MRGRIQKRGTDVAPSKIKEKDLPCYGESGKTARRREHLRLALKDTGSRAWGGHFRRQNWHEERHGSRVGLASLAECGVHIKVVGAVAWECLLKVWTLFPGSREPSGVRGSLGAGEWCG